MALKLNSWYLVTKDFRDDNGYSLNTGEWIRPTKTGSYSKYQRVIFDRIGPKGYYQSNGIYPSTIEEVTKVLELVEDDSKIQDIIQNSKLDRPDGHANLSANMNIGSDPEVFVVDKKGQLIPAFDFLPAEKEARKYQDQWGTDQTEPYWDGFQAEFKVPACTCHVSLTTYVRGQLKIVYDKAQAHSIGAQLVASPTTLVPKALMDKARDEHVALGCAPSKNAYKLRGEKPGDGRDLSIRFAGFHIHHNTAGYKFGGTKDPIHLVKSMDNIGGILSVSLLEGLEDPIRRQYYGLAGEFRTPKHGLEYRVISSAALWHPALSYIHLDFVRAGCQLAMAGLANIWEGSEDETVAIINGLDVDGARAALKRNKRLMIGLLNRYYCRGYATNNNDPKYPERVFEGLLMKGIKPYIELDMTKNWGLKSESFSPQIMTGLAAQLFGKKTMVAGS